MLTELSIAFLKRLLDTPGPSGFESAAARVWRNEAREFADVTSDVAGNSIAVVNPNGSPTIMLAGHIDEIGLMITHIDNDGFMYFASVGGVDTTLLPGLRVEIHTSGGPVPGAIEGSMTSMSKET